MSQEDSFNGDTQIQRMIASTVRAETEKSISACEGRILDGIQKSVSAAVETKYKVVIARLGSEKVEKDSHGWQIALTIIPVVLTIGLGWWVTKAQTEIVRRIDDQKQDLTTRLALTQEYQKRKLDVYQACAKSMSSLSDSLQPLRMDPKDLKAASDSVRDLYDCRQNNSLYVTRDVAALLAQVQNDGIVVMQNAAGGNVDTKRLEEDILATENQMLQELTAVTIPLSPSR